MAGEHRFRDEGHDGPPDADGPDASGRDPAEALRTLEQECAELRRRDAEQREILDAMRDLIMVLDADGTYLQVPSTAPDLLYRPGEDLVGRRMHDVMPHEEADRFLAVIRQALESGRAVTTEYSLAIDGTTIWFSALVSPMAGGRALWVTRDVTAQHLAEAAQRASEERYRLLFASNPMPMWVYDRTTLAFLAVNTAAERQYGYSAEEFLRMTVADIRPEEDVERLREAVAHAPKELHTHTGWTHRRRDGTLIEVEIEAHPIEFDGHDAELVLAHDVTARRQLEVRVNRSQKMEALGQLAGGVAHDFNNLLTAITSYSQFLLDDMPAGARGHDDVLEIQRAADRAASLTRQLLAFSRQQVVKPRPVSLNTVVREVQSMLGRLMGEDIEFLLDLEPALASVMADPGQIEQVLVNLVLNARDAMPDGGRIMIATSHSDIGADSIRGSAADTVPAGKYVMLSVSDDGAGMSPDVQSRIFEPFFTTKEPGRGTGLGLATVYGIVQQAGGHISLYSHPGQGTSFKIRLPRSDAAGVAGAQEQESGAAYNGTETILLVEDDDAVRSVARRILAQRGYRVIEARSGGEALRTASAGPDAVDLVLTDMVMPEMSGPDLAASLRELHPGLSILFMSGYSRDAAHQLNRFDHGTAYLEKPFTPVQLARHVRELLDEGSGAKGPSAAT